MGMPPRHGHGGWSDLPVQADVPIEGQGVGVFTPQAETQKAGFLDRETFLRALPHPGLTQMALAESVKWDPTTTSSTIVTVAGMTVPDQTVYVFCDFVFFAQAPAKGLQCPSIRLNPAALAGYFRFEVIFGGRTPMQLEVTPVGVMCGSMRDQTRRGGWPFTDRAVGVQRVTSFAIYAKAGQDVQARVNVDVVPDFPLTLVGVEMHGFAIPATTWAEIWRVI